MAAREAARLGIIPVGSLVAAALTPVGPVLLSSPFQVSGVTAYITEWQPPSPTSPTLLAALGLILLVVVDAVRNVEGRAAHVLLLTALALVLAVTYTRTAGVAAAIVAPLSAAAVTRLLRLSKANVSVVEKRVTLGLGLAALALAAVIAPAAASKPGLGANTLDGDIAALPEGTIVCNDWMDGGWLMWKHPNLRVTMDSRVEIYSVEHIRNYSAFLNARPGWDSYVSDNACSAALLRTDTAAAAALAAHRGWHVAAAQGGYVLLAADR
jgi:hypothetical protein